MSFLFLFGNLFCASAQNNLALKKPYVVSSKPNYPYTAPASDVTSLTDGVFTQGTFWKSHSTVGWQNIDRLIIDIDLGSSVDFNRVTFNTARGETTEMYYPANIFVFTSDDKSAYQYLGDMMVSKDNEAGPYEVHNFEFSFPAAKGRYVRLVVNARSADIFCDEIQVFNNGNAKATAQQPHKIMMVSTGNSQTDSLEALSNRRVVLMSRIAEDPDMENRLNNSLLSAKDLDDASAQMGSRFAQLLQMGNSFAVNWVNPWDALSPAYKPVKSAAGNQSITTVINGSAYLGMVVTNLKAQKSTFTVTAASKSNVADLTVYTVPFLTSHVAGIQTADPLEPNNNVSLDPGESRLFVINIEGKSAGDMQSTLTVSDGGTPQTLNVSAKVAPVTFNDFSLNAINWAWLQDPMITNRRAEAIKDLLDHHINTIPVAPMYLGDLEHTDAHLMSGFLNSFGSSKPENLLLFMNFISSENTAYAARVGFMSDQWKNSFKAWYDNIVKVIRQSGWNDTNIYIYPYDEVAGPAVNQFYDFLKWVKTAVPGIKVYMTVGGLQDNMFKQFSEMMDVMQLSGNFKPSDLPTPQKYWTYDTKNNAELLSPYTYYRMMAWRAYVKDFTGIGFWNYADTKEGTVNLILKKGYFYRSPTNFSVIYINDNKIVSSRRWEAFKIGIEDYELLKMYEKKFGVRKAKELASSVVESKDQGKADIVRQQMITELSR